MIVNFSRRVLLRRLHIECGCGEAARGANHGPFGLMKILPAAGSWLLSHPGRVLDQRLDAAE
jgi:hypothetical protein